MAMSGRQTNTMEEFIQKMLRLISDAKIAPDSDLPFLVQLETSILEYVHKPMQDAGMDMSAMPENQPPMDTGGMLGMGQGFAPTPGPGVPGIRSGPPPMPNPDELRRVLANG